MSSNNRSYRVHTDINKDKFINVNLTQDIDELNILSLTIETDNDYRLHTSSYGCLVGRVLANNGVGIPNAKVSVFMAVDSDDMSDPVFSYLYPYSSVRSKNRDGIRYNLLPDTVNEKCHQDIGTFPNKRLVLDDNNVLEVYDKYYKFTTTTNAAGDYMIFGLPVGNNIIHSELDLSDIGILSQKPRDLFYKGYNKTLFENSSQFKGGTNLDNLAQVIAQDTSVYVYPFWGDDDVNAEGAESQIKITRNDINISYKFEPTCIFIGSIVSDEKSQGFGKRCIPTARMGKMDRLTTGKGTIEMIRKTPTGEVESFSVQGNDLIDGDGTWCYQIPMNLDYVKTDEYGNLVSAENENVGIPTRARVRFRVSLADYESDYANAHLVKMLVPNNPSADKNYDADYNFGSLTSDDNFRDLLWNNVYTIKEHIPRIQKLINVGATRGHRSKNFSGIKAVNVNGSNNPMPYNNIRVNLTFLFTFQCIIFKSLVLVVKILNAIIYVVMVMTCGCQGKGRCDGDKYESKEEEDNTVCKVANRLRYITLDGAMCPETDGWYMALGAKPVTEPFPKKKAKLIANTIKWADTGDGVDKSGENMSGGTGTSSVDVVINGDDIVVDGPDKMDTHSAEYKYNEGNPVLNEYKDKDTGKYKDEYKGFSNVSASDEYFVKCVELQFAMEYEVIQFDFYNDWINGCLYIPRWFAELRKHRAGNKIIACDNDSNFRNFKMVQQCALQYDLNALNRNSSDYLDKTYRDTCGGGKNGKCHKGAGQNGIEVLNKKDGKEGGGIVHYVQNMDSKYLYYLKPLETYIVDGTTKAKQLFATDIVLLGNTSDCNYYGIPKADGYPSSTFIMPPPTIQVVDETQEAEYDGVKDEDYPSTKDKEDSTQYFIKMEDAINRNTEKEIAGIDWGFNPINHEETNKIEGQRSGHFLEIGCMNSMTVSKSCINLQRICELGAEMSQSHFSRDYSENESGGTIIQVTGIVSNREVIGNSIRAKFASLNNRTLIVDKTTKNYTYDGMIPNSFDGSMHHLVSVLTGTTMDGKSIQDLYETKSKSYLLFRLGIENFSLSTLKKSFYNYGPKKGETSGNIFGSMPIYKNSFYFYFGLRDGNTAIDRLYSEYFSECTSSDTESINE